MQGPQKQENQLQLLSHECPCLHRQYDDACERVSERQCVRHHGDVCPRGSLARLRALKEERRRLEGQVQARMNVRRGGKKGNG